MGPSSRLIRIIALLALCFTLYGALSGAEPLPFSAWYNDALFTSPKLSPDGLKLGAIITRDKKQYLAAIELSTFQPSLLAESKDDARLINYWWKSSDLLLLLVQSVNGSVEFRSFDLRTKKVSEVLEYQWNVYLINTLPADPENVVVAGYNLGYAKLNVRTGKLGRSDNTPEHLSWWVSDQTGNLVAAGGSWADKDFLMWRPAPGAEWQRRELGPSIRPNFSIISVHPDQKRLIAWDYTSDGPAKAVALDPNTMTTERIPAETTADPDDVLAWSDDHSKPRALAYETDRPRLHYFSAEDQKLQTMVDASLPNTVNRIVSCTTDEQIVVVYSQSDHDRGSYYLLDRKKKQILPLGLRYNGYDPAGPCPGTPFQFTARDGLLIHGRLILPHERTQKPPLVLIAASDGFAGERVHYSFIEFDQILASRGYAVARIDYRGTTGYGRTFMKAGDYQIDKGMPNDLADGVGWLIQQGLVDEKRVVLCGGGYGGIVAIHTLARNPGMFAAWINIGTPFEGESTSYERFAMAPKKSGEAETDLGGWQAAAKYASQVDPSPLIPGLKLPSYHTYVFASDSHSPTTTRMQSLLKKGSSHHILKSADYPWEKDKREQFWIDYFKDIFGFLEETFGRPGK